MFSNDDELVEIKVPRSLKDQIQSCASTIGLTNNAMAALVVTAGLVQARTFQMSDLYGHIYPSGGENVA